ncbi:MAG TPA: glycosyltransferase [Planctomycetota bacterium]|nr:glycosyltransferase [Planctomycetota bacterium]
MTRVSLTDEEVSPSAQVSVVIPAYNRAGQVGRALESVSRQTYPHWEIVVVDDASTDGTAQAVEARAADIGHLRLARHACNLGAQAARNTGIRASRGPWIAFLDSDDWWEPDSLELRLAEARNRGVQVVHSDCFVLGPDGSRKRYGVPAVQGDVHRQLLIHPGPMFPALLVTRRALDRVGGLDESLPAYQEWDTAIRLARHFEFGFVDAPTFVYDCSGREAISRDTLRAAAGHERVVRKHAFDMLRQAGGGALAGHSWLEAGWYWRGARRWAALRCLLRGALAWPFRPQAAWRLLGGRRAGGGPAAPRATSGS